MTPDDFRARVKTAVDTYGIMAVANVCNASLPVVRRWTEGFPPHGVAQASVLKAIDHLGDLR